MPAFPTETLLKNWVTISTYKPTGLECIKRLKVVVVVVVDDDDDIVVAAGGCFIVLSSSSNIIYKRQSCSCEQLKTNFYSQHKQTNSVALSPQANYTD
jgi:hypothetical protein